VQGLQTAASCGIDDPKQEYRTVNRDIPFAKRHFISHRFIPDILPGLKAGISAGIVDIHDAGCRLKVRDPINTRLRQRIISLLTKQEDGAYESRFDIDLLTWRLERATQWVMDQPRCSSLDIGYFGASTGAAAALNAAATFGTSIGAVVSRGGRPDLALAALASVQAPTLLIVGGLDDEVIELNRQAYDNLKAEKHLAIVKGATHLFEEPGTLPEVARLAAHWFKRHLGGKRQG